MRLSTGGAHECDVVRMRDTSAILQDDMGGDSTRDMLDSGDL